MAAVIIPLTLLFGAEVTGDLPFRSWSWKLPITSCWWLFSLPCGESQHEKNEANT